MAQVTERDKDTGGFLFARGKAMQPRRILTVLIVSGVALADLGSFLVLSKHNSGGFKYFSFVLAGLVATTIGLVGLGLSSRR